MIVSFILGSILSVTAVVVLVRVNVPVASDFVKQVLGIKK